MISPLHQCVDDETFRMVSALCGEDTAFKLCYEDVETAMEVKTIVDIILNGVRPGGKIERREAN